MWTANCVCFSSNGFQKRQARRSFHDLRASMYETLPKSLKAPTLVRTKTESLEVRKERSELVRTKTLVKNCIVQIDATPFSAWYLNHYGINIGNNLFI